MIFREPFQHIKYAKDGKWFAWHPVTLERENKIAWLSYVNREWIEAAGWGFWQYSTLRNKGTEPHN